MNGTLKELLLFMCRVDLFKKIKDFGYDAVEITIEDRSKKNIEIIRNNLKNWFRMYYLQFIYRRKFNKSRETDSLKVVIETS